MEDRLDNITSCDNHGSDRLYRCELALKRDGTMLSLRFQVIARQLAVPDHRAVPHQQRPDGVDRGADQQVPAGRLPRLRLGGDQLDARAHGRRRGRRAENGPDRTAPQEPDPARAVPVRHPERQPVRQRELSRGARGGAAHRRPAEVAEDPGRGARQGPLRRHRRRDLPGAQRVQRDRVLVAQRHREPGLHAHELAGVDARIRIDPTGAIHVTLGSPFWGNSPETMATRESSPSSSRSIRRRSTSSTRTPRAASTPPARAAAASR